MYGGKSERHFRVVQLDGKKVELGGVSITQKLVQEVQLENY